MGRVVLMVFLFAASKNLQMFYIEVSLKPGVLLNDRFTVVWLINSGNLLTSEAPEPGFYAAFKLGCGIMLPFTGS
ncbi:hypothetical protein [Bacteroides sp.]